MITRYALFEGKVKDGHTEAFRKAVIERILPKWKQFPHATDVRISFAESRDEGAPELSMILAITIPTSKPWKKLSQAPCAPRPVRRPRPSLPNSSRVESTTT